MKGRILLIAYQVPPLGGARGIRIAYFIKYLTQFGWKIDVVTVSPSPNFPLYDPTLVDKLPGSAPLFRTYPGIVRKLYRAIIKTDSGNLKREKGDRFPGWRHRALVRVTQGIKNSLSNLVIPDVMVEWYPWAAFQAIKLVRKNQYDMLISFALPFTTHLVAYTIKKVARLPWVAECGDPWVFDPMREKRSRFRFWFECRLEDRILSSVDALVVTTEETKDSYLKHYPFLEGKITVVPAGVDDEDFQNLSPPKVSKFRILYTGRMYKTQEIRPFVEAVKAICEHPEMRKDIEVLIVGDIDDDYRNLIASQKLNDVISIKGFVPLREALSLTVGADVLLFLGNKGGLQVPSRLFYYLGAKRPLLYIKGDSKDASLRFINGLNRGIVVENKTEEIYLAIIKLYELYCRKELDKAFDLITLPEISWENRVRMVDEICHSVVQSN